MAEPQQHQNDHPAGSPGVAWCTKNPGCSQDAPCDECQALADGRIAEVHLIEYRHHRVRVPWVLLRRAWLADQPLYLPDPGAADDPQPGWLGGDEEPGRNVWEVLAPSLGGSGVDDLGAIRVQDVALEYPDAGQFAKVLTLWLAGRRRLQETEAAAGGSQPAAGPGGGEDAAGHD